MKQNFVAIYSEYNEINNQNDNSEKNITTQNNNTIIQQINNNDDDFIENNVNYKSIVNDALQTQLSYINSTNGTQSSVAIATISYSLKITLLGDSSVGKNIFNNKIL